MSEKSSAGWRVDRRDFLIASAGALFGLMAGCRNTPIAGAPETPAAPPKPSVRFGMLTDLHYADANTSGTRYYRQSLAKAREAVAKLRDEKLAFLAALGDLKDMVNGEPDTRTLTYLTAVEAELRQFGGPTYYVLGNHDMDNLSKTQVLSVVSNTGIVPNKSYYAFSKGGVRFITLDGCCLRDGRDYDHNNFDWRQTWISPPQIEFLKTELKASKEPVIIFVHQRLDGIADEYIKNSPEVRAILEESGKVLACFHGHDHKGGHNLINGIHYYTLIAVVEGNGEANNSYAVAEVHPDLSISITGYRRAVSRTLPKGAAATT
jgi:predicted phosphohydrolase